MEQVDFYKLARPVQERFIGSINGGGLPTPILELRAKPKEPGAWLALSGVALVLLMALFRVGLGDLTSSFAIQGPPLLAAYVLLFAALIFGLLRAFAIWQAVRALPFRAGAYVFPVGLIDARRHVLRVYKIEDLKSVDGPDARHTFRLTFDRGVRFELAARDAARAAEAESALASARGRVQEAGSASDSIRPKALAALDPLQGFANPLVSSSPIRRTPPPWARFASIVALLFGGVLGTSAWAVHNALSDDVMYAAAVAKNDSPSYRAYMRGGKRHKNEVERVLLPRAELKDAEKAGTVDAIEKFIKEHPETGIPNEVAASLRAALLAELAAAKQIGTLAALTDFTRRHPEHHLEAEIRQGSHGVYQTALENYRKVANPKDPHVVALMERLVAFAEKKGPQVQVRFRRIVPKSMERADTAVSKNRAFQGVVSLPSRYFDPAHAHPHEAEAGRALIARFQQAFPPEILAFEMGPAIDDPEAPLPPVTVPTLFIEHGADWTGAISSNTNPRGVFVGLGLVLSATFQIADDPKPFHYKTTIYRSPDLAAAKGIEKAEEQIYTQMDTEAFAQFDKKLLGLFFKDLK